MDRIRVGETEGQKGNEREEDVDKKKKGRIEENKGEKGRKRK